MSKADEKLAPWNGAAAIVFILTVGFCFVLLESRDLTRALYTLSIIDVLLIAFAAFRLTHLFTYDKILNAVRDYFMDTEGSVARKPQPGFRRLMCELLECLWCTSMWSGLIVVMLYTINPLSKFLAIIIAIAGAASLLQIVSKSISVQTEK